MCCKRAPLLSSPPHAAARMACHSAPRVLRRPGGVGHTWGHDQRLHGATESVVGIDRIISLGRCTDRQRTPRVPRGSRSRAPHSTARRGGRTAACSSRLQLRPRTQCEPSVGAQTSVGTALSPAAAFRPPAHAAAASAPTACLATMATDAAACSWLLDELLPLCEPTTNWLPGGVAPAAHGFPDGVAEPAARSVPAAACSPAGTAAAGSDTLAGGAADGAPGGGAGEEPGGGRDGGAAPPAATPLRCLDERHSAACLRCVRPQHAAARTQLPAAPALAAARCRPLAPRMCCDRHSCAHCHRSCVAAPPDSELGDFTLVRDPQVRVAAPALRAAPEACDVLGRCAHAAPPAHACLSYAYAHIASYDAPEALALRRPQKKNGAWRGVRAAALARPTVHALTLHMAPCASSPSLQARRSSAAC
jgi:hypothetical protein